jgi:hypothetical protein
MSNLTAEFTFALKTSNPAVIPARLRALGFDVSCRRCGGGGHYSRNSMGQTHCYACSGSGFRAVKLSSKLLEKVRERVAAGKLDPYLAEIQAKIRAKRLAATAVARAQALYDAPVCKAIVAATVDMGMIHNWLAPRLIRQRWHAAHQDAGAPGQDDAIAFQGRIEALAAQILDRALQLKFVRPSEFIAATEDWEQSYQAAVTQIAEWSTAGLALMAQEPWWKPMAVPLGAA